ncbi:hypothetical protein CF326_g1375 [Tilletia indica]|nr:hypothetical protein CF326_g1375 [Tilletia indica]
MAVGADAGSFNTLWFLVLIPIILVGIGIVLAVWIFISRRRRQRKRQSVLRNVPVIQAEAEAEVEKMERRASVRSKRSVTSHRDTRLRHDPPTLEKNLTRSFSTRSQREVYVRTLKARQHQQQMRAGGGGSSIHTPKQPHPTTFRLGSSQSQSDTGHNRLAVPSHFQRSSTPELEEGRAGFPDAQSDNDHAQRDVDPHVPASDDSHTSSKRYHQYRRQDANELSVIGEADAETSQAGMTPSASQPSATGRMFLSPSSVLAAAALAAEPDTYAGDSSSPVGANASPFRDPEPNHRSSSSPRGLRQASSASTTDASNTTYSSHRTTGDDNVSPFGALPSSETSGSTDDQSATYGSKTVAVPMIRPQEEEDETAEQSLDDDGALAVDNASSGGGKTEVSPGLTPKMTHTAGGVAGGSPAHDPNAKTPTMPRTPSPAALAREAQDRVDPIPDPEPLGSNRLGGNYSDTESAGAQTGLGLGSGTGAEGAAAGAGAGVGGVAGRYLAPLLPNFLRPSHNNEGNTSRASLARSDISDATAPLPGRSAPSPHSPTHSSGPNPITSTPTRPRASMTSLRSALAAPTPMMPTRSATGGSTGGGAGSGSGSGSGGGGPVITSPIGVGSGVGGMPGGSAWTYTSRASEWKSASSTSVARGGGMGMVSPVNDPRASSTSLASRASSRDGHSSSALGGGGIYGASRPGLQRKTSHGVAGSLYREHFGEEDEEEVEEARVAPGSVADDHSSRVSHMLEEDEEREREKATRFSASPVPLERKGSSASKSQQARSVAAALMRKTSSRSGRSSRVQTLGPQGGAESRGV